VDCVDCEAPACIPRFWSVVQWHHLTKLLALATRHSRCPSFVRQDRRIRWLRSGFVLARFCVSSHAFFALQAPAPQKRGHTQQPSRPLPQRSPRLRRRPMVRNLRDMNVRKPNGSSCNATLLPAAALWLLEMPARRALRDGAGAGIPALQPAICHVERFAAAGPGIPPSSPAQVSNGALLRHCLYAPVCHCT